MIEPQPGVMVRGPASEGEEGRGWPVWVIAALALLSAACSSPRAPAPRRSGPDPFAPPRSARPKPEARDVEPGDLSSDSPALRAAAREKALAEGEPGELDHDLARLCEAEGLALDPVHPQLPRVVQDAALRLRETCLAPGGGPAIARLLEALRDRGFPVRPLVALILGPVPGADITRELRGALQVSDDVELRRAAASALGHRAEPDTPTALAGALTDPRIALVACEALGRLAGRTGTRPALEETVLGALAEPALPRAVLAPVIRLAAELHIASAGPLLTRRLAPELPEDISATAARGLGAFSGRFVEAALRDALTDPRPKVRAGAVAALVEQGDVLSLETFRLMARRDASAVVRAACVRALVRLDDPDADRVIEAAVEDPAWTVRVAAIDGVAQRGLAADQPKLRALLADSERPAERTAAARALGALGDRAAEALMIERLESARGAERVALAEALTRLATARARPVVFARLETDDAELQLAVLRAMRLEPGRAQWRARRAELLALAPVKKASDGHLVGVAAAVTAYQLGETSAGSTLRAVGPTMLRFIGSSSLSERRQGRRLLIELAGRDFAFEPTAEATRRALMEAQIRQWWEWRRERL